MALPICSSTSTKYQVRQLGNIDDALGRLRLKGIGPGVPGFDSIYKIRSEVLSKIGYKVPRDMLNIIKLVGLSPGTVTVWFDTETGWFSEARERPGAPPVYHAIDADTAVALVSGELTKELEERLMAPVDYLGE